VINTLRFDPVCLICRKEARHAFSRTVRAADPAGRPHGLLLPEDGLAAPTGPPSYSNPAAGTAVYAATMSAQGQHGRPAHPGRVSGGRLCAGSHAVGTGVRPRRPHFRPDAADAGVRDGRPGRQDDPVCDPGEERACRHLSALCGNVHHRDCAAQRPV
jgi:hypothetical protein